MISSLSAQLRKWQAFENFNSLTILDPNICLGQFLPYTGRVKKNTPYNLSFGQPNKSYISSCPLSIIVIAVSDIKLPFAFEKIADIRGKKV